MQAVLAFVLLIGLAAAARVSALRLRTAGQAMRPCDQATESCTLLTSCPELQNLLRPPTEANIQKLHDSKCDSQNSRHMVCCPIGPLSPPATRPASPPVSLPASPPTSLTPSSGESLLPKECGYSLPGDKIQGGTPAALGAYPWMVVLGFQIGGDSSVEWNCGGSLINDRYVLTAAHCLMRPDHNLTVVRLGENNLETEKDCIGFGPSEVCAPPVHDFSPEEVVLHPEYEKRGYLSDDLALIRLDRPVNFSHFIQPVCLPGPNDTFEGLVGARTPAVIGFGVTEFGRQSLQLLEVFLPAVARRECIQIANYATTLIQDGGQVCLGGQFQQDACMKDSGGPAMVTKYLHGPPYIQVGVVSYGNQGCGLRAVPSIYTDVAHYRRWIVDNLKP